MPTTYHISTLHSYKVITAKGFRKCFKAHLANVDAEKASSEGKNSWQSRVQSFFEAITEKIMTNRCVADNNLVFPLSTKLWAVLCRRCLMVEIEYIIHIIAM